jgi:hypothetical protein
MKDTQVIQVKENEGNYTRFWDMHSGGNQKLAWSMVLVNLPKDEAIEWFENRFNRNPENVTCNCCGEDYSISSAETLEELTKFHRNEEFKWRVVKDNPHIDYDIYRQITDEISLDEYLTLDNVLYVEVTKE